MLILLATDYAAMLFLNCTHLLQLIPPDGDVRLPEALQRTCAALLQPRDEAACRMQEGGARTALQTSHTGLCSESTAAVPEQEERKACAAGS